MIDLTALQTALLVIAGLIALGSLEALALYLRHQNRK